LKKSQVYLVSIPSWGSGKGDLRSGQTATIANTDVSIPSRGSGKGDFGLDLETHGDEE
jgi:hypothetical protein